MRCPKCGYISFDRQKSCGKCSHDLSAVAEQLVGTAYKSAAPFFLGAVLGRQNRSGAESGPDFHEEDETLALDELDAEAPPTDEEELDFARAPLDEDDLEDRPLPSLGLEDIDVSDLVPPEEEQQEEEAPVLHLGNEQKETILGQAPAQIEEEEDSLMGIELPSLEPDDLLSEDENESAKPQTSAEDEEIIDLSSLMGFDETPAKPAEPTEEHDTLELSLGDAPEDLHLNLDDDAEAPAKTPQKPASAVADIPDLGLTLENDDQ